MDEEGVTDLGAHSGAGQSSHGEDAGVEGYDDVD